MGLTRPLIDSNLGSKGRQGYMRSAKAAVHSFPQKRSQQSKTCFAEYQCELFFGLAREDIKLHGEKKKDWKAPSGLAKRSNKILI